MHSTRIGEKKALKVALHSLGCKVNAYETQAIAKMFEERGYEIVPFDGDKETEAFKGAHSEEAQSLKGTVREEEKTERTADIYVINTCTVTNIADRKSRQMLHKAKKKNPDAVVVAVGCYAQAFYDTLQADEAIDLVVGNDRKKEIVDIVEQHRSCVIDINDRNVVQQFEELQIDGMSEKTRAYIKIQDGCNQFCTYCIIPYARGRVRSRQPENILQEVDRLIEKGYQEVVLTGIHLSSYGIDWQVKDAAGSDIPEKTVDRADITKEAAAGVTVTEKKLSLTDIVQMIGEKKEIKRIRLSSLEPRIITRDFLEGLQKVEAFCPHFHLSLQSGCDATLKRMNRRYTAEEYKEGCRLIREYFREAAITTDVIVGFPGETEEDFLECEAFVQEIGFAKMHIFKYSRRQGTKAAVMAGQIDDAVKNLRSSRLLQLDRQMHLNYMKKFLHRRINVLFEEKIEIEGEDYFVGHTAEYIKVAVKTDRDLTNQLLMVETQDLLNHEIMLAIL